VIVADLSKQPERVPPPVPPQPQVKPEPQIKPQTAVIERAAPAKRKLQEGTKVELQSAIRAVPPEARETPPSALANMPAASPAAAPPPPPQQQQGALTPSPKAQQQLSDNTSVSAGAASELNRAAAVSGFRAASPTKEMAADKSLDKKAGPVLQWSILRADSDLPPATLLDPGDTIRLRIVPPETGTLTLTEGDKQLASASVEASQAFDTLPIPYTIAGPRHLRVTLTTGAAPPFTFLITLNYR